MLLLADRIPWKQGRIWGCVPPTTDRHRPDP